LVTVAHSQTAIPAEQASTINSCWSVTIYIGNASVTRMNV